MDNRLARLARQWGGLALVAQFWIALAWLEGARADATSVLSSLQTTTLIYRMSQLKAAAFKFPFTGAYVLLFALVSLALIGGMLIRGLKECWSTEEDR